MPNRECKCNRRPNLTPHINFVMIVVMLLGFKFLPGWLVVGAIVLYLVHTLMITMIESRA